MSIKIVQEYPDKYPLRLEDLEPGKLYQASNGTFVIQPDALFTYHALNIANGLGGYGPGGFLNGHSQFRVLKDVRILITTDDQGRMEY